MNRRSSPKTQIQRVVFERLRLRGAPRAVAFHPAHGGYRKPIEAAVLKGLGVRVGLPGVVAVHEGRRYELELRAPGGRPTRQLATIAAMEAAGAFCCIAEGLGRALGALEAWGLLRGQASITADKQVSR